MDERSKRLRIMAGPNGSGKSTILQEIRNSFESGPFVNADEIEKTFKESNRLNLYEHYELTVTSDLFNNFLNTTGKSWIEKATAENSQTNISCSNNELIIKGNASPYDAALAADFVRHQLLLNEKTFTFETVLSHHSKINFLQQSLQAGYRNYLYFICTVDPAINIERVNLRVHQGGHAVPADRIIKRYQESLEVLSQIIPLCYRVYFFDNSSQERSIEPIAEIDNNEALKIHQNEVPWWLDEFVIKKLYQ